jgi:two-component system cell cycle response regulator
MVLAALAAPQRHHLRRHSTGVAALGRAVGRRLGLGGRELRQVVRAVELHDVGKLVLPDALLHKAEPLEQSEWELIRRHTIVGERILAALPALGRIGRLVRSSHERWDGLGYPDSLAGEDIPLASRIIFACGAIDAMTSERPYQRAKTSAEALAELGRGAGKQFDRRVVRALVDEVAARGAAPRGEGGAGDG